MPADFPTGEPPERWRELLRRADEFLRARMEEVRQATFALEAGVRRRWPAIRARILAAHDTLGRRAAAARRHAPTPRQAAILGAVALLGGWLLWESCGLRGCPDVGQLTSYQPGGAAVLLDRHGERFADLAPMEYEVVPLDSLPPYVALAFVAVEDRRFFEHRGVDWIRVLGALRADIRARAPVQGSSTIPMQLARTLFPDRIRREEKSFGRKLLEARVAREIEDRFTKVEILELYLNHVYLGAGTRGVEAASRYYFGKPARELELPEAALLAALPRAPAHYDPRRRPEEARARRDLVLALMQEQRLVDPEEAGAARARDVAVVPEADGARAGDGPAPYFVQHVRRLLEAELGAELYAAPRRILTTLDPAAQQAAEDALEDQLRAVERGAYGRMATDSYRADAPPAGQRTPYVQGAVVFMDARTGEVRAWIGGRDFDHSRFDRARLARRQAGSAFKPFVYAAALERGFVPSQPILDGPFRFALDGGRTWQPRNYSGTYEGRMSMREALVRSQNVPAARLAAAVGTTAVADFARRAGIQGQVPASPVAALGVTAVSPAEMASAYAGFATLGTRVEPRFVLRVEDAEGAVLWWGPEPERAAMVRGDVAYILTDMLRDVVDRGTGTRARSAGLRGPAAGKTGTTSDATDVWFVGYTPELVGVVWVGYDDVRPLPYRATGGGVAAPIWGRVMARAHQDRPPPPAWEAPAGVLTLRVDPESGMVLRAGCRIRSGMARRELFLAGTEPPEACPRRADEPFVDRLAGWFESVFGGRGRERGRERTRTRIPDRGPVDPALGVPRLPRAGGA
ncbi:MAG: PBP1A family penicillin-binding protein [Gemmatimonadota bacterium]